MKNEIHFLSDVFVAVASLDLTVPFNFLVKEVLAHEGARTLNRARRYLRILRLSLHGLK